MADNKMEWRTLGKINNKWRLQPSVPKTLSCIFHLHNASASQDISVQLNDQHIRHEPNPVYLAVTLHRTLSYHAHLKKSLRPKLALVIISSGCWLDPPGQRLLLR